MAAFSVFWSLITAISNIEAVSGWWSVCYPTVIYTILWLIRNVLLRSKEYLSSWIKFHRFYHQHKWAEGFGEYKRDLIYKLSLSKFWDLIQIPAVLFIDWDVSRKSRLRWSSAKRQEKAELYGYSGSILAFSFAIGGKRNIPYKVSCFVIHHYNTSEPGNILMIYISNCSYATLTVMLLSEMNLLQILCLNSSVT